MLRGCIFAILLYVALAAGYYLWFSQAFEPPETYFAAAVAGLVTLLSLGSLTNARRAARDWSLLARARDAAPLDDGRTVAVEGEIHPVGEPLAAPFSGEPCVLCEYEFAKARPLADSSDDEEKSKGRDFTGFLMTPSVIRSRRGDVRLLGFPELVGVAEAHCGGYTAAARAFHFLSTREFDDASGAKAVKVFSVFGEIWADDDGRVEKHLRIGSPNLEEHFPLALQSAMQAHMQETLRVGGPGEMGGAAQAEKDEPHHDEDDLEPDDDDRDDDDLDHDDDFGEPVDPAASLIPTMIEKRVNVGEPVCVVGVYRSDRRGLAPRRGSTNMNKLYRGSAADVARTLRKSFFQYLIGGLLALSVVNGIAYAVMTAAKNAGP